MWFKAYTLDEINIILDCYMTKLLGIKVTAIDETYLVATMPVTDNVRQPFGILHGGASVVLAETIGTIGSNLIIDPDKYVAVGLDINANHLHKVTSGKLFATCQPLHIGSTTHVWDVKIKDDKDRLICASRLTTSIIKK